MPVLHASTAARRLVVLLVLCLVAVVAPGVGAHAEGGPVLKVTASGDKAPRYGDDVVVTVTSTGFDVSATLTWRGTEVAPPQSVDGGGARFTIPNQGRFLPGQTYTFSVSANGGGDSYGVTSFTFTPVQISSSITLSSVSAGYRSTFFGIVEATSPTSVVPTGRIEMRRRSNGFLIAAYDVRTDGTFALRPSLAPGTYQDLEVRLTGSAFYADTTPTTGSAVADFTITPLTTKTTLTVPGGKVVQGDQLLVTPSATFEDPYTDAPLDGRFRLFAKREDWIVSGLRPAGAAAPADAPWVEIAEGPVTGVPTTFDLTDWAATHEGNWSIYARYDSDPHATPSNSATRLLQVRRPGKQPTQVLLQLGQPAYVVGQGMKVHPYVKAPYDQVTGGTLVVEVDGEETMRNPLSGVYYMDGLGVGTHRLQLHYLGTERFEESRSETITFEVARAATEITVQEPTTAVAPGTAIPVRVDPVIPACLPLRMWREGPEVVPEGPVRITEDGRTVASFRLAEGVGSFRVPALRPGTHRLEVVYGGDADTEPSATALKLEVTEGDGPDPQRAKSLTRVLRAKPAAHRKVGLLARVTSSTVARGSVVVMRGKRVVARGVLKAGRASLTTKTLPRGRARLVVKYLGSPTVRPSSAKPVVVRVR